MARYALVIGIAKYDKLNPLTNDHPKQLRLFVPTYLQCLYLDIKERTLKINTKYKYLYLTMTYDAMRQSLYVQSQDSRENSLTCRIRLKSLSAETIVRL